MNKLFLVGGALLLSTSLYSQKPDKENAGSVCYEIPPADMSLQSYKNVFFRLHLPAPKSAQSIESTVDKACTFSGFERVADVNNYDFLISITITDNGFDTPNYPVAKSGETETYGYNVNYGAVTSISVIMKDGNTIYEKSEVIKKYFEKKGYKTKNDATQGLLNEKSAMETAYFEYATNQMLMGPEDKYCYLRSSVVTNYFIIKPKKFDYTEFNACFEKFKQAVSMQNYDSRVFLTEEMKPLLSSVVETLLKIKDQIKMDDNKAQYNKDNAGEIYYNLALTYFVLRDYDNALTYFEMAQKENKLITLVLPGYIADCQKMIERKSNMR